MLTKRQTKKVKQIVPLKDRLMRMLRASRFRFINETLYTNNSSQSNRYFKEDPDAFDAYHDGYKQQVEQWPVNPLDVIISYIKDAVYVEMFKHIFFKLSCKLEYTIISIISGQLIM